MILLGSPLSRLNPTYIKIQFLEVPFSNHQIKIAPLRVTQKVLEIPGQPEFNPALGLLGMGLEVVSHPGRFRFSYLHSSVNRGHLSGTLRTNYSEFPNSRLRVKRSIGIDAFQMLIDSHVGRVSAA
jgi:hypothetical protein